MKQRISSYRLMIAGVCYVISPVAVFADEISILDCSGHVRAVSETRFGNTHVVTLGIVGPKNRSSIPSDLGVVVEDAASAVKAECSVAGGVANCPALPVGAWKVCFSNASYDLGDVSIREQLAANKGGANAIQTAALIAGSVGGVAALVSLGGSDSNSGDGGVGTSSSLNVDSTSGGPGTSNLPSSTDFCPPTSALSSNASANSRRRVPVGTKANPCLNDATPVELSPFE